MTDSIAVFKNNKYTLGTNIRMMTDVTSFSAETDYVRLYVDGTLELFKGYQWDGATGAPDYKPILVPSAIHDAFYRLIRENKIPGWCKKAADYAFYMAIRRNLDYTKRKGLLGILDIPRIIRNAALAEVYYYGVKFFGFIGLRR